MYNELYLVNKKFFIGKKMGIHYDYKSTRGMKAMEKAAKRERKLAEKKLREKLKKVKKKTRTLILLIYRNLLHLIS